MFAHRQQLQQRRELRAVAQLAPHLDLLRQDVVAGQPRAAPLRDLVAREDLESGGLAGAVDAQEAEHLSLGDAEGHVAHRHLAAGVDVADAVEQDDVISALLDPRLLGRHVLVHLVRRVVHVQAAPEALADGRVAHADVDGDGERQVEGGAAEEEDEVPAGHDEVGGVVRLRGDRRVAHALNVRQRVEQRQADEAVAQAVAGEHGEGPGEHAGDVTG
mmetsp:Transcript_9793/g.30809  ORF Transcript_9793/g.30809 Transcript_9793/m.30809 type:complete len:217 (+) Transcript_9793:1246-1896(+)